MLMEYFVGVALALGVGLFTTAAGFDRDRALYPVILIVVASYYDLFAVMGGGEGLVWDTVVFAAFLLAAIIGFRTSLWVVVFALVGHGVFDLVHGRLIANPGVPAWWPMFCLSYDVAAGGYLAWLILAKKIAASNPASFGSRIRAHVDAELAAAKTAELAGNPSACFRHLERAHVLGQGSTAQHVRVHVHMLMWGLRHHDRRQVAGQIMRVIGAATKTWAGLVPHGNTGGANVSAFKPMAISDDLAGLIAAARSSAGAAER
jgi:Protein of unknown function (DUF3703)